MRTSDRGDAEAQTGMGEEAFGCSEVRRFGGRTAKTQGFTAEVAESAEGGEGEQAFGGSVGEGTVPVLSAYGRGRLGTLFRPRRGSRSTLLHTTGERLSPARPPG